jgi:PAS domain S-box-containing protein
MTIVSVIDEDASNAAANQHFSLLVNGVREYAMYMLDPQGRILTWNAGGRRLKGYTPAEIIGENFSRFFTQDDRDRGVPGRILESARKHGEHRDAGWRVRKDGTRFWADVLLTALYDGEGTFKGFAKVTRDETEKHEMQERLRASEERFRLLVGGLKEHALYMLDPGGHLQSWNEGAQRIKQYSEAEVVGRHFSIFFTPDDRASNKPQRELDIAAKLGSFEEEGWRLRKDGTRFWASVVVTALMGADGQLKGFAKVTRDETKRHQANIDLQQALDRAIDAEAQSRVHSRELENRVAERTRMLGAQGDTLRIMNAELEQFAYIASHDLQEPLRMITMHLDLLKRRNAANLDERSGKSIALALAGTLRMRTLIDSLLAYSRLDHVAKSFDPVDAGRAAGEAVANLEQIIAERRAEVAIGRLPLLPIQYGQLVQVLQNLIANGIKYNRSDIPTVAVSARREGAQWIIAVEDNGIGIPAEYRPQLFQPFRRLHDQDEFAGSGVGLAIVKKIIERHGGQVGVADADVGACITFTLQAV